MDGVLVSTEEIKAQTHSECTQFFGKQVEPKIYKELMGQSFKNVASEFIRRAGLNIDNGKYRDKFNTIYRDKIQYISELSDGLSQFIKQCQVFNLKLGVVTSSERWMLEKILRNTNMLELFDATVAHEDVTEEKPSPDPYLLILRKISVSPNQAIVFEDSEAGIQAANKAEIRVFGIRHQYNQSHDFGLVEKEFSSFLEVDLNSLFQ